VADCVLDCVAERVTVADCVAVWVADWVNDCVAEGVADWVADRVADWVAEGVGVGVVSLQLMSQLEAMPLRAPKSHCSPVALPFHVVWRMPSPHRAATTYGLPHAVVVQLTQPVQLVWP